MRRTLSSLSGVPFFFNNLALHPMLIPAAEPRFFPFRQDVRVLLSALQ